ncbi:TPA: shikimate dehydrogenase, partial [Escherichia coli]
MSKKLIIFGAGGFSKSIIDSLNHKHYELIGFIDKYKSGYHQSYPILGNDIADIENK